MVRSLWSARAYIDVYELRPVRTFYGVVSTNGAPTGE